MGFESCGCLGLVQVSPLLTASLNCLMILALICWKPSGNTRIWPLVLTLLLVLVGVWGAMATNDRIVKLNTRAIEKGDLIVVDTIDWVAAPFPLDGYITDFEPAMSGYWTVIVYHDGCSKCQTLINEAKRWERNVAFVGVSPCRGEGVNSSSKIWRRLSSEYEWFVESPLVLKLNNGYVSSVKTADRN